MKNDTLLEELYSKRINQALELSLAMDKSYQKAVKDENRLHSKLKKIKLNKRQSLMVDRAIFANNLCGAEYGRAAYRQGFQDAVKLLKELSELI